MKVEKTFAAIMIFALIGVIVFAKSKVCQDRQTGNLVSRPWLFPCPSGSDAINSASTD